MKIERNSRNQRKSTNGTRKRNESTHHVHIRARVDVRLVFDQPLRHFSAVLVLDCVVKRRLCNKTRGKHEKSEKSRKSRQMKKSGQNWNKNKRFEGKEVKWSEM